MDLALAKANAEIPRTSEEMNFMIVNGLFVDSRNENGVEESGTAVFIVQKNVFLPVRLQSSQRHGYRPPGSSLLKIFSEWLG